MPVGRDQSAALTKHFYLTAAALCLTAACVTDRTYATNDDESTNDTTTSSVATSDASGTAARDSGNTSVLSDNPSSGAQKTNTGTSSTRGNSTAGIVTQSEPDLDGGESGDSSTTYDGDGSLSHADSGDSGWMRDDSLDGSVDGSLDGSAREQPVLVSVVVMLDVSTLSSMDERATLSVWCKYDTDEPVSCTNRASIDVAYPNVAVLNDTFQLEPVTNGSTSIVANVEGMASEPAALVVDVGPVCTTLRVDGKTTAPAGTSVQWTASCDYDDGSADVDVSDQVTWQSEDYTIAPISQTGEITADAVGSSVVTASVTNPDRSTATAQRSFTVTNGELVSIAIAPVDEVTIPQGQTARFNATCEYTDVTSECTTNVTWVSSSPVVATVDRNGVATANETGTASLSANFGGLSSNSLGVTVTAPVLTSILLTPNSAITLEVNTDRQLTATCVMSNATSTNCTSEATWNSSAPSIGAINAGGRLAGLTDGTTLVTASLDGVTSATVTATVVPPKGCEGAIDFPDEVMMQNVREHTGKAAGSIYYEDVKSITVFEHNQVLGYLEFLDGIQCFTSLESLTVQRAWLADITPIVGLIHLEKLDVAFTQVWSIPDLSLLTKLSNVDLSQTRVTDLYSLVYLEHFADGDTLNVTGSGVDCDLAWSMDQLNAIEARGVAVASHCGM